MLLLFFSNVKFTKSIDKGTRKLNIHAERIQNQTNKPAKALHATWNSI